MATLFWVCVGIVIGWNLPQPPWARSLQEQLLAKLKGLDSRGGR